MNRHENKFLYGGMKIIMHLCKIQSDKLTEALILIKEVFDEFDAPYYTSIGIKTFYHFISAENMRNLCKKEEILFCGAYEGCQLIGVIALRGEQHLSLLFVKKEYQRRGVAKKLFRYMVDICKNKNLQNKIITVNSSPYAVEIYKRLGFAKQKNEQTSNGIRYTPMIYLIR